MKPKDIGLAYDQLTHLWLGEAFDRNNGITQHRQAVAFLESKGHALDVGCGCSGRLFELFEAAGLTPEGVDISAEMVAQARSAYSNAILYHADICQWQLPKSYALISAWDSLWHLPLEHHQSVLQKLVEGLQPGGVLIFSFGGLDLPDEHCNSAMGPEIYYSTLGVNGFVDAIRALGCQLKHLEFDQLPEKHCYLIAQKPQT
ncbi:class I SAM-dependent methyltransferase [Paraferrimonas sedimenticola]|uniref:Methyltransferase n=1 Tax=Paraferrimonas sedimenticola TaxID=375674 RepID=A0AA37VT72_9GAMM|nr:class I SAM-dependent methyltransferase [Paraferrimonas sedimenticola]GLP95126.1 methyltransferase [Paraferrimonas sedimenticola]